MIITHQPYIAMQSLGQGDQNWQLLNFGKFYFRHKLNKIIEVLFILPFFVLS